MGKNLDISQKQAYCKPTIVVAEMMVECGYAASGDLGIASSRAMDIEILDGMVEMQSSSTQCGEMFGGVVGFDSWID